MKAPLRTVGPALPGGRGRLRVRGARRPPDLADLPGRVAAALDAPLERAAARAARPRRPRRSRRRPRRHPRLPGSHAAAARARAARARRAARRADLRRRRLRPAPPDHRRREGGAGGRGVAARVRVVDAQGMSQTSVTLGDDGGRRRHRHERRPWRGPTSWSPWASSNRTSTPASRAASRRWRSAAPGRETIAWTHHPVFLDQPAVRLCRLDGNPFQEALREIAAATAAALRPERRGERRRRGRRRGGRRPRRRPAPARQDHGAAWIRRYDEPFDLVVAGVPAPKDRSLYQASRAATYVGLAARPVVADGGLIVCCADLPLGVGDGPGETNFGALLAATERPLDLVARGCVEPLGPGGQRAYMMAKLMSMYRVGVVGGGDRGLIESLGLLAFAASTRRSPRRAVCAAPRPAYWPSPTASTPSSSSRLAGSGAAHAERGDGVDRGSRSPPRAPGTSASEPDKEEHGARLQDRAAVRHRHRHPPRAGSSSSPW